jgi:hypothetical protein
MNIFEKAVRQQLRFELNGQISIEQLYASYNKSSAKTALKQYANQLQRKLKDFSDFDVFSDESVKSTEQELTELKLEVVKQLYSEILLKEKESKEAIDVKAHNAKIDALIAQKQEDELSKLSLEELQKLRK